MQIATSSKYVGSLPFSIADPSWCRHSSPDQSKIRFNFLKELRRMVPNYIEKMRGGSKEPVPGLAEGLLRSGTKEKSHWPLPLFSFPRFISVCPNKGPSCSSVIWNSFDSLSVGSSEQDVVCIETFTFLCNHWWCCYFVLYTVSFSGVTLKTLIF